MSTAQNDGLHASDPRNINPSPPQRVGIPAAPPIQPGQPPMTGFPPYGPPPGAYPPQYGYPPPPAYPPGYDPYAGYPYPGEYPPAAYPPQYAQPEYPQNPPVALGKTALGQMPLEPRTANMPLAIPVNNQIPQNPGAPGQPAKISRRERNRARAVSLPATPIVKTKAFSELLSQPVSTAATNQIGKIITTEDTFNPTRAVGMAAGSVPAPDEIYSIPFINRRHSDYYSNDEVAGIMQSILDPHHARQVLARIIVFPARVIGGIAAAAGLCAVNVSILNGFLSFLAVVCMGALAITTTNTISTRAGSGRFFDPLSVKLVWMGAFVPFSWMIGLIVLRAFVPQPFLSLIAFGGTAITTYVWLRFNQDFQVKRLLQVDVMEIDSQRNEVMKLAKALSNMRAKANSEEEVSLGV